MICQNQECKREFLPKRSDSNHCSLYCCRRNRYLKNAKYYKEYLKEYRKTYYPNNKEKILARNKSLYYLNKDKRLAQCREYRSKNIEKDRLIKKKYKENNKDKISLQNKEYRIKNLEKVKKAISNWSKRNLSKRRMSVAKRRAKLLKAIPKFADLNKIKEIYKNCPKGYEVDHIIPLQGKNVSGLHIETNLQYLPMLENRVKSNKFIIG